ncbi:MAG TPA: PCRF domain-containing protein, partial [Bacteroidales bacterium]|nr:PCRF domain-containing protein [Bacteroidales bacterium]
MAPITMLDKLEAINQRFLDLEKQLAEPDVMSDMKSFVKLNKDYKELQPIIAAYKDYRSLMNGIDTARTILNEEKDPELREFAKEELDTMLEKQGKMEEDIRLMLIPADPQDSKNAVVEIRAGTGGDEASLFAGDLFRMYTRYCEAKKWKVEPVSVAEGTVGGFKEVIFQVKGDGVYGLLKYESGVHRVQRVPATETQGRVHTSAATVAVLPEADEFDVEINPSDIRKDTYCSS